MTGQKTVSVSAYGTAEGSLSALLLLADGRFPTGGHAHSGGFEPAAGVDGLNDVASLEAFLRGRLGTVGLVSAAFSAASCRIFGAEVVPVGDPDSDGSTAAQLALLDAEYEARTPSPVLRTASRRLGRSLLRAGRCVWPHPGLDRMVSLPGKGPHQPIAFGAVAAAAGQPPRHAALAAAHEAVAGPATAAIRLLGLDPFEVNAALARLAPAVADVAGQAAACAHAPPADLPANAGYLLDIFAELHATWEVRLFAS
ncbi:urease accessory UreF family protein [Paenarthrobacter sp. PH39-S1]|uniref:urease accessory protein UreF n=1 Tax=Paenarthrobacter sp. PH39-S1 TaxID=3046204 RepID=UPI0024BAE16B|nr:urease accessory UreF family protein [Paenarthrobacter sp. PH39-S1]MDJ0355232.1 urease accessory UreF family protein [Paenarthrobacter sp. PH39-S1]